MGSRTWVKLYCDKWLKGTVREFAPEIRSIWADLLVLAGSGQYGDTGEIKVTDEIGLTDNQISRILHVKKSLLLRAKSQFLEQKMIEITPENAISVVNWSKYQSEYDRIKPLKPIKPIDTKITNIDIKSTTNSTENSTPKSTALERDKRIEIIDKRIENKITSKDGDKSPLSYIDRCNNFDDYKNLLSVTDNQVGFLVAAFKRLHSNAPDSDFQEAGGRLGKLWASNNRDTGYILKKMWDITSVSIAGSHLNYLDGALRGNDSKNKPKDRDPDKYTKGKYGHMVQR